MNLRIISAIFRKEMLDTLRDKRTLIAMIGVPVLLYPAMFLFMTQAALMSQQRVEENNSKVSVTATPDSEISALIRATLQIEIVESDDPAKDLTEGVIDAAVTIPLDEAQLLTDGGSIPVVILYDQTEAASRRASERISDGLLPYGNSLLQKRLAAVNLSKEYIRPLALEKRNVASAQKTTGTLLGGFLPLMMVLMVGLGAFYPAVDLTAGEKERGTFETLLSTPARKLEIVCGKFVTVFCLAMITGLLNIGSMALTFTVQFAQLPDRMQEQLNVAVSFYSICILIMALIPLAFLISAGMMSIAVFARNFKEAQNYVTPFFLLITFPAALAGFPGLKLGPATQFIPIGNVSLLFKELMIGDAAPEQVFAVLLSTTIYALLALVVASWVFQREEVVLSEDRGIPFTFHRSGLQQRRRPTFGLTMFLYAGVMLLVFHVGASLQAKEPFLGLLATLWLLILAPTLLLLWFTKVDLSHALSLRLPNPLAATGALIIAISWIPLALQAYAIQDSLFTTSQLLEEVMQAFLSDMQTKWGFIAMLFAAAVSPAICEEILFRGAMLSGVRGRLPMWAGVLLVGTLFGAMHMSVYRLAPATLSGIVLTYMVWRSGSIYTGMLSHFVLNLSLFFLQPDLAPGWAMKFIVDPLQENGTLSWPLLVIMGLFFVIGVLCMERSRHRPHAPLKHDGAAL